MTRWEDYWRNLAHFERLTFLITHLSTPVNQNYPYEAEWYTYPIVPWAAQCGCDPPETLTIKSYTDDTGSPSLSYQYLGFNNERYNVTWRKIMSHAIDYTYVIEELKLGNCIRANSPISPAFGSAYNESSNTLRFNITFSRLLMKSLGFGDMEWNDSQWITIAEGSSPFLTVNFTYNVGNIFREDFFISLKNWFKLIGIKVVKNAISWENYLYLLTKSPKNLGLFVLDYYPTIFEPFRLFNELYNPKSVLNSAQVNDPWLNNQISIALNTTDINHRNMICKKIQGYITQTALFHAPLFHSKIYFIHSAKIYNPAYNSLRLFEAYYMYL